VTQRAQQVLAWRLQDAELSWQHLLETLSREWTRRCVGLAWRLTVREHPLVWPTWLSWSALCLVRSAVTRTPSAGHDSRLVCAICCNHHSSEHCNFHTLQDAGIVPRKVAFCKQTKHVARSTLCEEPPCGQSVFLKVVFVPFSPQGISRNREIVGVRSCTGISNQSFAGL
jgi:hypothetical protein